MISVITGASSGIGRALALILAETGATLYLLGRDEARLQEVADEVEKSGATVHAHAFDLTDDKAVKSFAASLTRVNVLIHSAGTVRLGKVAEASVSDLDTQYRINLRAPYLLTQCLLPQLRTAKGHIVFINSGAGLNAKPEWSQYAASKHALRALADSLRAEVNPQVRVTSIYPGRIASPMQRRVREFEGKPYDPKDFMQPEDVAQQVKAALSAPHSAQVHDLSIRPL